MANGNEKHFQQLEHAVNRAKEMLSSHQYPDGLRTVIVAGFIDLTIEHHEAMLLLIRHAKIGSAFALARSIFESMYRGMWINFCASEKEIERFEKKDEIDPTLAQMAGAIDTAYRADGFFKDLKKRAWPMLNSYTHSGMLQLGRRFTGHKLQPAYSEQEAFEITTATTTCVLTLIRAFFGAQNHPNDLRETEKLIESYGPAAEANRAVT